MRLSTFSVNEFRSVWDSGSVTVGDVTCLVGKNEAGKTTLLKALYRLAPLVDEDAEFDPTDDYPRKEFGDYQHAVESGARQPTTVISAVFTLEDADIAVVADVFGPEALQTPELTLTKGYANERRYTLDFNEAAARANVVSSADLTEPTRAALSGSSSWTDLQTRLKDVEETTEVSRIIDLGSKLNQRLEGGRLS